MCPKVTFLGITQQNQQKNIGPTTIRRIDAQSLFKAVQLFYV